MLTETGKKRQILAGNTKDVFRLIQSIPSKNGWRAKGVPVNVPYKKKKAYEIDIPSQGLDEILKGKYIGTDIISVKLQKVYISLDNVFKNPVLQLNLITVIFFSHTTCGKILSEK